VKKAEKPINRLFLSTLNTYNVDTGQEPGPGGQPLGDGLFTAPLEGATEYRVEIPW
jgi:hypothetical protein